MIFNSTLIILTNMIIICSKFLNIHNNSNGGAVSITTNNNNISFFNCLFKSCSSSISCGSIYMDSTKNNNSIYNCIFFNSSAPYIACFNSNSNYHFFEMNSISFSTEKAFICSNIVIYFVHGAQNILNVNSSFTNANHHSGIHQSSLIFSNVKFITLFNQKNCEFFFGFNKAFIKPETFYCNIINNSASISLFYLSNFEVALYSNINFINNIGTLTSIDSRYTGKLEIINNNFNENIYSIGNYFLSSSNLFIYQNIIFQFNHLNNIICEKTFFQKNFLFNFNLLFYILN